MFANNCNKAIRCCVWQTSTRRSFMANKLSTIIDRCATIWLMLPTPWGWGRKKEKRKWTRVESMRHFTLHCNTFRATYWYWPCLERQARRSLWTSDSTPLELIVIVERKARINMQQTEREGRQAERGARKANWHAATCVLSRSSNQMWQLEPNWECVQRNAYH